MFFKTSGEHPNDSCINNANGYLPVEYNGTISVTASGYTCQNWLSTFPRKIPLNMLPDEPGSHNHNYCRNEPGQSGTRSKGAWCYTTDPKKVYEECSCNAPNVTTSCCKTIKVLFK